MIETITARKLTREMYANQANDIGGDIDSRRFRLADLALQAQESGIEEWAEIMANCPNVRRSVRTVRHWRFTAKFCRELPRHMQPDNMHIPFNYFSAAAREVSKGRPILDVIDWLSTCHNNPTVGFEDAISYLRETPEPSPPPPADPPLSEAFQVAVSALLDLSQRKDIPKPARDLLEQAVSALRRAFAALGQKVN